MGSSLIFDLVPMSIAAYLESFDAKSRLSAQVLSETQLQTSLLICLVSLKVS